MKKSYKHIIYITAVLFLIVACENKSLVPPTDLPDIGIPPDEYSKDFKLSAPEGWNTFKVGDAVGLAVEVVSSDQIAFAQDFGARLFIYENNQWVEVANFMNYPEGYLILSPAKNDPLKFGAAFVDPLLPDSNRAVTLRTVLVGNIYRDGKITDEIAAAYIDVDLKP
jgi:hypothetical protein